MRNDWKAMYEADEEAIEAIESALARKDAALAFATKALEQAASHAKERLDWCDDWQEEERWDREDTLTAAALEFCRKALKEEDTK